MLDKLVSVGNSMILLLRVAKIQKVYRQASGRLPCEKSSKRGSKLEKSA
jgi:hypothetical protein